MCRAKKYIRYKAGDSMIMTIQDVEDEVEFRGSVNRMEEWGMVLVRPLF